MADLQIIKPQNENEIIITPQAEDRLVLDFNPTDVLITREDNKLIFSFEDNKSRIVLEDFYVAYSSENMPEFEIQGAIVPGLAFFEALSDDLMPAAGPAASTPQGGGTIVGTETTSLLDAQVEGLEASEVDGFYGSATPLSGFPDFATTALADADAAPVVPLPDGVAPPTVPTIPPLPPLPSLPIFEGDRFNNDPALFGTNDAEIIYGYGGDDGIFGMRGDDFLFGGDGDDILNGGIGNDFLFGEAGSDQLIGGSGNDLLLGTTGDELSGGSGFDVIKLDNISINDVLSVDGGADIDMLLSNTSSFADMQAKVAKSTIEIFINGTGVNNLNTYTVADMYSSLESVGIDFNENNNSLDLGNDWRATNSAQNGGFVEYTNDNDLTILVNTTMVTMV